MVVCPKCKKELQCKKTGMQVRFNENGHHTYAGDIHACPTCGLEVVVTNRDSGYDPELKTKSDWDVWMDVDGKGYEVS